MKYRILGRTDIEVSVVSLGCWAFAGDISWGPQDDQDSIEAIQASLDAGVNFFDTAEGYGAGKSEEILGKVLASRRQDAVIATKVSPRHLQSEVLKQHCEDSLRRLQTDYIDLYQIHWPSPEIPISETLGVMQELVSQGKVRAVGVSNFGVSYLKELLESGRVESNQLPYSLLWRPIEHEILPTCVANDISILTYSSLFQGLLTGKFASPDDVPDGRARPRIFSRDRPHTRHGEPGCERETFDAITKIRTLCDSIGQPMGSVSLGWLLAQPGVTSVITGARNAQQATQNARAADLQLSPDIIEQLSEITEPIKTYAGTSADMWQSDSRMEKP